MPAFTWMLQLLDLCQPRNYYCQTRKHSFQRPTPADSSLPQQDNGPFQITKTAQEWPKDEDEEPPCLQTPQIPVTTIPIQGFSHIGPKGLAANTSLPNPTGHWVRPSCQVYIVIFNLQLEDVNKKGEWNQEKKEGGACARFRVYGNNSVNLVWPGKD